MWRDEPDFLTYYCARCMMKGYARVHDDGRPDKLQQLRADAAWCDAEDRKHRRETARWLWRQSVPVGRTVAENYLRSRRRIALDCLPATLRYLPPMKPEHHPAIIAALAMPSEPEPSVLSVDGATVSAVHLTLLKPNGSDKAGTGRDKFTVGRSPGVPIVLAPLNDPLGLAITEGIEEGVTVYQATCLGVWVAGSASRMPALADAVPDYANCITIIEDDNEAGRRGARGLAERLCARGLHTEIVSSSPRVQQERSAAWLT